MLKRKTSLKYDLPTKLLGGAILGIGIGLVGMLSALTTEAMLPWTKPPSLDGFGCAFWLSIAIGLLMLVMMFRVFNSQWTPIVRRQQEHGLAAFPWLGLCFAPLLLVALFGGENAGILWSWVNPESSTYAPPHLQESNASTSVSSDVLYEKKSGYLNPTSLHCV